MKKDQQVIIVKKKKHGHGGHHGGAWKVAYADFVTAMMAFFLVMWLVSQKAEVRAAVAGYFRDPGAFQSDSSRGLFTGGRPGAEAGGTPPIAQSPIRDLDDAERQKLSAAAEHIRQQLMRSPQFANLRDQIEIRVTAEGLRIELVEKNGSSFFDNGSAVLRGESEQILSLIAHELTSLPNDLVVEGHTDSRPYVNGHDYGNWELSSDRANAARRVMERTGLHSGQVRAVRGFADTELRFAHDPLDPRNRRVSILVRSQAAAALQRALQP
jgi:chemotaxis protein MotB